MMNRDRKNRLGIPMERTVKKERPGRWMPVIWLLFAVALTVGIIAAVQTFVPIDPKDRANSTPTEPVAMPAKNHTETAAPKASASPTSTPTTAEPLPSTLTTAPAAPSPSGATSSADALKAGSNATLTVRTQAAWREGGRATGVTYLPPGTSVVIDEELPGGKYRVHWREADAQVPAASLAPLVQ